MTDQDPKLTGLDRLRADIRRLWWFAARAGAVLAIACHMVPPKYRVACDALRQLCTGDF